MTQKQLLIRFTGVKELELHEFLRKESFETGLPMAEIVRRGIYLYKNKKEEKNVAKNYRVEAYRYLKGPHEDPISNMRHSQKSAPWNVLETDVLDEAIAKVKEIEAEDESVRAYVIRTSDGAQYGGGLWV